MTQPLRNRELFDDFSIWLNEESKRGLGSQDGFNITDIDKAIHAYRTWTGENRTRDVQCVLYLEAKTFGAEIRPNQTDTLFQFHQLMTTSIPGFQVIETGRIRGGHHQNNRRVVSYHGGTRREVDLKCYGIFLLRMSGSSPANSEWMQWGVPNRGGWFMRSITIELLRELLQFKRHPVSWVKDNPARPHKKQKLGTPIIPGFEPMGISNDVKK